MGCSMDMLSVIKMRAPAGPVPDGMKVTAITDPNSTQSAPTCPALAGGGFTLWPMSYYDNRVSFGMVMYDLEWGGLKQGGKAGARYGLQVTLVGSGRSA